MSVVEFRLPDVGEGLAEAEIVEWLVAVGEEVEADQAVVTVETAKAQVDLPAPVTGRVVSHAHTPGDMVPVGDMLFVLEVETDASSEPDPEPESASSGSDVLGAPETSAESGPAAGSSPSDSAYDTSASAARSVYGASGRRRVLAAPSTRKLAVEQGVDLNEVAGTGPNGRVEAADVLSASRRAPTAPQTPPAVNGRTVHPVASLVVETGDDAVEVQSLRGLRRQIARAMTATLDVPHITDFREIDATALIAAREALQADAAPGERITLLPLLVRVVVAALRRHPDFNAHFDPRGEALRVHARPDIGIATAAPDGLIVPVIRAAGSLTVRGLAQEIERLAAGARDRSLPADELTGATFTVSNFGSFGSWLGTPLIAPPQVSIAGFGRVRDTVVAHDGVPAVRRVLPVAVAADHRVIDGAHLGEFVNTLERLVRSPLLLLGEG